MGKSLITGIDISHQSIKAVVLKPEKNTFALVGYHQMPVEAYIFTDNYRLNYQKIVKKLKELRKALPLFSRKVCLSVPDSSVISKQLQIDSNLSDAECQFAITQAFARQSSVDVETLYLDFTLLSHDKAQDYQVYAVRKGCVDSRVAPCLKAGMEPVLINPYSHNLAQLWRRAAKQYQQSNWLLIDFNWHGIALYCEDEPLRLIDKTFSLESLKHDVICKTLEKLVLHIRLLDIKPDGIWLSGEIHFFSSFIQTMQSDAGLACIPLKLGDLFRCKQETRADFGPQFSQALGLALSGASWLEKHNAA
ncbi:pilus assembly protein PilM [Vibrio coralliilyticus]|uniref:pilus assembly protein PilM n=1 Tax=Vibrio coralliilyticus TaxID=190893 RepID=UPI0008105077|nr:pilus assembly protein PilM [Vibrio coralliilyticus]ANW24543.1 pilus assembly protein PilM [Vibrio coralliilyticus]